MILTKNTFITVLLFLPQLVLAGAFCDQKVTVAILDDGFDMSHPKLLNYWWTNPEEVDSNRWDDDQDGFIDNIHGFDIADNDGDPNIPEGRGSEFYHGTFLSGEIVKIWEAELGDKASECLKILPIKLVPSLAQVIRLEKTVEGLELLKKHKVDVVLMAWSQEQSPKKWKLIINEFGGSSVIFVAAAGNLNTKSEFFPAALPGVISVGATDLQGSKMPKSNYGSWVDITARGSGNVGLMESGFEKPNVNGFGDWVKMDGQTSSASARVAAYLALLKNQFPKRSKKDYQEALLLGAKSLGKNWYSNHNLLGVGGMDYKGSVAFLKDEKGYLKNKMSNPVRGIWKAEVNQKMNFPRISGFDTLELSVLGESSEKPLMGKLIVRSNGRIWGEKTLNKWLNYKEKLIFPSLSDLEFEYLPAKGDLEDISLSWNRLALDSSAMYCSEKQVVNKMEGVITDGSPGRKDYPNNLSCKWQFSAPVGMRVQIEFEKLDTELGVDKVHFFNGEITQQTEMLIIVSGQKKPPVINSISNKLLLWFVTDSKNSAKGWKLKYRFVDAKKQKAEVVVKP